MSGPRSQNPRLVHSRGGGSFVISKTRAMLLVKWIRRDLHLTPRISYLYKDTKTRLAMKRLTCFLFFALAVVVGQSHAQYRIDMSHP